jgi:hypothetical protein
MRWLWPILLAAAAGAGYLAGARSGEGPGTRARETPRRLADAPAQVPTGPDDDSPSPQHDAPAAGEDRAPDDIAPVVPGNPAPPVPVGESATSLDIVHAGSPFDALLRDELGRGGSMGLLRGVLGTRRGPWSVAEAEGAAAIVRDGETFARVFAARTTRPVVSGAGADWSTLADGTTLVYPEGVFDVRWSVAPARFPRDLHLKGAGMDRTLLRVRAARRGENEEIHGLTLAAVTIDCGSDDLLRLKSGLAAVRLVECRIVPTYTILGGADAGAVRAERCEFEVGRLAGELEGCRLLATTRGLARLDDCVIRGTIDAGTGHFACLFRRCTFVQVHANLRSNLEGQPGVRLEDCRFEVVDNPPPPRRLHAINPAWRD